MKEIYTGKNVIYPGKAQARVEVVEGMTRTVIWRACALLCRLRAKPFCAMPGNDCSPPLSIPPSFLFLAHTDLTADVHYVGGMRLVQEWDPIFTNTLVDIGASDCTMTVSTVFIFNAIHVLFMHSAWMPVHKEAGGTTNRMLSNGAIPGYSNGRADVYPSLLIGKGGMDDPIDDSAVVRVETAAVAEPI